LVDHAQGGEVEGEGAPLPHRLAQRQHHIQHDVAGGVDPLRIARCAAPRAVLHRPQLAQFLLGFYY